MAVLRRKVRLLVIGLALNLFVFLWINLMYNEKDINGVVHSVKLFQRLHLNQQSKCLDLPYPNYSADVKNSFNRWQHQLSQDICAVGEAAVDIQLEMEWEYISVQYPKYILSVSGWLQTLKVESFTVKPLKVIIVPHSHQDPGWLSTLDSYYNMYTHDTLELLASKLTEHPDWKFIWSEVIFLERWWTAASQQQKEKFKSLVSRGQLEIVTGGWVMTDEGTAHYSAMLNQLMEGHLWLSANLGVIPNVSWSVDPFGHSPTMTYLLGRSNQKNMVIQRVNYAVKSHLAATKSLEFHWLQAWDKSLSTSVFCHMMPFLSYAIPYSCGPDPHVCCKFDFHKKKCFHGHRAISPVDVTSDNIAELAFELWESFQKKSELYRSDVILVPHGDDFRFSSSSEWDQQFNNLTKLIGIINNTPEMQTQVKFGTLSDYFHEVSTSSGTDQLQSKYPTLSGDFFTYTDRDDQYWSGYYTTRPHYKHMARRVQALLRSVEILFSMAMAQTTDRNRHSVLKYKASLWSARQNLALFQHHDAITGTSKHSVVSDYGQRLHSSYQGLCQMLQRLIAMALTESRQEEQHTETVTVNMNENWEKHERIPTKETIVLKGERKIAVYNTLATHRQDIVTLQVNSAKVKVIEASTGNYIACQISPLWNHKGKLETNIFELAFLVELSPLSITLFLLVPEEKDINLANVLVPLSQLNSTRRYIGKVFSVFAMSGDMFSIRNKQVISSFSVCDGRLQYVTNDGSTTRCRTKFMRYTTGKNRFNPFHDKSGAYTFQPDGPAQVTPGKEMQVFLIEGLVFSKVISYQPGVLHSTSVYNTTGILGQGVYIENIVDIGKNDWNNTELIMRLDTDVMDSTDHLCTDLNGFQMHRKRRKTKLGIQGNFYPMTSAAAIETEDKRLTLLSSESHGVASLSTGWLEVVIDRRLTQGDWRGLNKGVIDNVPTKSQFILLLEKRKFKHQEKIHQMCYLSSTAMALSSTLENPVHVLTVDIEEQLGFSNQPIISATEFLFMLLPCDTILVNLRYLDTAKVMLRSQSLLVLHRQHVDCGFLHLKRKCSEQKDVVIMKTKSVEIADVAEMSITGIETLHYVDVTESIIIPPMEIKTFKISFI